MNPNLDDSNNPYAAPREPSTLPPISTAGPYPPCPKCGHRDAEKVSFTWWGGVLGPRLFKHVKCKRCGKGFNGTSGKSNTMPIVIYTVVGVVVAVVLIVMMGN
jgi:DNA-directed RNA polymerase subunit RPC12/RpoP